jgi:isopentenyl-diphosphate delta-isomerase
MADSEAYLNADEEQKRLMAEQCILLDENDKNIGGGSKLFCHQWANIEANKALHRAFSVFLFNSEGKLLLQQRSSEKITFPDRWTNTCCSHPLNVPTETEEKNTLGVKNAAIRKLDHEMGIPVGRIKADDIVYVSRIIYKAQSDDVQWGEHEIDYCMFIQTDLAEDELKIVPNEVKDHKYVTQAELKEIVATRVENGIEISPWFHMIMDQFGYKWWDNLSEIMANKGLSDATEKNTIHPLDVSTSITS